MPSSKRPIDLLLEAAGSGDRSAARSFFQTFPNSTFFVPDRHQEHPLSDAPEYPTPLVHVLGVREGERSFVPFFTEHSFIQAWCGAPLRHREVTGKQLLEAIPEAWWGIINPGQEIQKEFSPWELVTMRGIPETIDELLEELYLEEAAEPVKIRPIDEQQYAQLAAAIRTICQSEPLIQLAHLAMEVSSSSENEAQRLILNVSLTSSAQERERLRDRLRTTLAPLLIGAEPLQILVGAPGEEILAGLVQSLEPLWSRA